MNGEHKDKPIPNKVDLDAILVDEIGPFGKYQIRNLALAVFAIVFAAFHSEYIFTTARIKTRCLIPECEDAATDFTTPWVYNAIPSEGGILEKCSRYGNTTASPGNWNETCPAELFDTSIVLKCEERVYENKLTVVYDFDLGCDEWSRAAIGTMRKFGTLLALPITGYISDRWGRRTVLVINCFNAGWIGLTRYWINSYTGFIISELLESFFGAGVFSTTHILMLELVGPKHRVLAGGIVCVYLTTGGMLLGLIAWIVPNWRSLTLALYIPQLFAIGYIWFMPESVRWYMSKERYAEAEALLIDVARINKKHLSDKSLEQLRLTAIEEKQRMASEKLEKLQDPWLILLVFKHKQMLKRCLILPFWWVSGIFVYYGLSINSVNISGNPYVNYIAASAVEIPGFLLVICLVNRIGRKPVIMGSFWVCAVCQFAYVFMPKGMHGLSLSLYLVGKCAVYMVMSSLYMYTSELFPTKYRHNLLAYCATVGRLGAISAPLTPAIAAATFPEMPFIMFGGLALVSGFLLLLSPETLGTKLPDTMEEAEQLGVKNKNDDLEMKL